MIRKYKPNKYFNEECFQKYRAEVEHRDEEGYLHHDSEPALICKPGAFYFKHGLLHREDGPAAYVGPLDTPYLYYFFDGEEIGKGEIGWLALWRIKGHDINLVKGQLYLQDPYDEDYYDLMKVWDDITEDEKFLLKDYFLFKQFLK